MDYQLIILRRLQLILVIGVIAKRNFRNRHHRIVIYSA